MTSVLRLLGLLCVVTFGLTAAAAEFSPTQLRDFPQSRLSLVHGKVSTEVMIWVADTPQRQQQGLMFLTELPPGYGMLFPLEAPRVMSMWMKNTYVSLDMVFIGADHRIRHIAQDTTPLSTDIISSGVPITAVLEIRAGEARRLGLRDGDEVVLARAAAATP